MKALLGVVLFVLAHTAFADGKIWSSTGELPSMPSQRAFLSWKNGVETLIVETDFLGEPGNYTWLIPVPGNPTKIEALEPGALETLQLLMPIRLAMVDPGLILIGSLALFASFAFLAWRKTRSLGKALFHWILALFIVLILALLVMPVFAGAGVPAGSVSVGSYSVSTLKRTAELPADIPISLRPTLQAYQAEGWSVVSAKLKQTATGVAAPHPLRVTFPSREAVYPMRLTGVEGRPLHLDLFVAGTQAANHPSLHRFSATRPQDKEFDWERIDHPDLVQHFIEDGWLVRLSGKLAPADLQEDLKLTWESATPDEGPSTDRAIDSSSAPMYRLQWGLLASAVAIVVLGTFVGERGRLKANQAGLAGLMFGALASLWIVLPMPRYEREVGKNRWAGRYHESMVEVAIEFAREQPTAETAEQAFFRSLKSEPSIPPQRAVPGGFTLKRMGNQIEITSYDRRAAPTVVRLPEKVP